MDKTLERALDRTRDALLTATGQLSANSRVAAADSIAYAREELAHLRVLIRNLPAPWGDDQSGITDADVPY